MRQHNGVVTFDQVRGTVTLRPNQATTVTINAVLSKGMNHELRERLREILRSFHTTFPWTDEAIGQRNVVQHTTDTGDAHPHRLPARRIPFHFRDEMDATI